MLLFLFVVALVSVGVGVPVVISRRVFEAHDTFSAVWQAHDMLTNYMHNNKKRMATELGRSTTVLLGNELGIRRAGS